MKFLTLGITLTLFSGNVLCQETDGIDTNLEDDAGQYAECAAYYAFVAQAMNSSSEPGTPEEQSYRELLDTAGNYSLLLAMQGRSPNLAAEVTNSRVEMYAQKMIREAEGRNENISILINKYHFGCNDVMENPLKSVTELLRDTE